MNQLPTSHVLVLSSLDLASTGTPTVHFTVRSRRQSFDIVAFVRGTSWRFQESQPLNFEACPVESPEETRSMEILT